MTGFQSICENIPDAFDVLAKHLTQDDASTQALGLLTGGLYHSKLAKSSDLRSCSGISMLNTNSMLEAASYGFAPALGLLAGMNSNAGIASTAEVRKNVASASFLSQIYAQLRKTRLPSPMSLAVQMRDILNEMDEHFDKEEICFDGLAEHRSYDAEISMIASLWNAFMPEKRERRTASLEAFACSLDGPVGLLHWDELSYSLNKFLQACTTQGLPTLEIRAQLSPQAQKLYDLWDPNKLDTELYDGVPVDISCGETLEEAAQAAAAQIGYWLEQDSALPIGIVGYDRILVRRVHSLLKEQQILIKDNTGWLGNNLLVGKALLALASTSSPSTLAQDLSHVLAQNNRSSRWWSSRLKKQSADRDISAKQKQQLEQLELEFSSGSLPPSEWFERLINATRCDPLKDYFNNDPAGMGICTTLRMLADEFATHEKTDDIVMNASEMGRILADTLRTTRYMVDTIQDSKVELISPGTMGPRSYYGVLLLGADANTLPRHNYQRLFNEGICQYLNLPSRYEKIARSRLVAAQLLGDQERIAAIWQGEMTAISPYLSLMETRQLAPMSKLWEEKPETDTVLTHRHASLTQLPRNFSASSGVDWIKCPYMFHAKKMLRLARDGKDEIGQRVNFGNFIHIVLNALHDELIKDPKLEIKSRLVELTYLAKDLELDCELNQELEAMSAEDRELFALEFSHYHASYAKELSDHLADFSIVQVEMQKEKDIDIASGQVRLVAKFDRLDENKTSKLESVVDIKTGSANTYKDAKEFPQLPIYLALTGAQAVDSSAYWVFDLTQGNASIKKINPPNLNKNLVANVCVDLGNMLKQAYEEKTPLPANGISEICSYCDYQGLCRKEHWKRNEG